MLKQLLTSVPVQLLTSVPVLCGKRTATDIVHPTKSEDPIQSPPKTKDPKYSDLSSDDSVKSCKVVPT